MKSVILLLTFAAVVSSKIFFEETFTDSSSFEKNWVHSTKNSDAGKFKLSAGSSYGDITINQGLQTSQDAKFYAASTNVEEPFSNKGKKLVVSFTVKHDQGIDCGGGYVKLLPAMDAKNFNGDTEYWMMFGPDICGYTKKIHLIFNYGGKNLLWKKEPRCEDDKLTHLYTVIVNPDNTYEVKVDGERKEGGKLEEDWEFLKPKMIDDPSDKKPSDWVDEAEMDDPSDKKPEDWDKESETIADPEAKQPEDWDEAEDGKWEAPQIPNPKHKGSWKPKRIPNPKYKGEWKPKQIDNPDYKSDSELYESHKPIAHVGFDLWQVKSGTIFDNIIIADSEDDVNAFVEKTWKATKDKEKEMHDASSKKEEKKDEEKKDEEKKDDDKKDEDEKEDL